LGWQSPETVATSVFGLVSADVDMPIVSMFYDGNGGQNRRLEVFLNNAVSGKRQTGHTQIGGEFQPGWTGKDRLVPVQNLTPPPQTELGNETRRQDDFYADPPSPEE
jgi:hypothetical protein